MRYHFRDFELDPQQFKLYQNGQQIDLEPQVLSALIFLIQHRHTLVSKQQLIDAVWLNKVVTDSAISHTIYQLRKILADDAKQPSVLRTVHGRGYEFIASVEEVDSLSPASSGSKSWSKGFIAVAAIALFIVLVLQWQQNSPKATSANGKVVITPFSLEVSTPELEILATAVSDYLVGQFTQHNLNAFMPAGLTDNNSDVWAMRYQYQAEYIVEGTMYPTDDGLVKVSIWLTTFPADEQFERFELGSFDLPYPSDNQALHSLFSQRRKIVEELLNLMQPGLTTHLDSQAETLSAEAYRLVIAAYHLQRSDVCAQFHQAKELLDKALALDPEFAYAWRVLFANYYKRVWVCGESVDYYQKAFDAAKQAEILAPGRYEILTVGLHGMLTETGRIEQGYASIPHNKNTDPNALYREAYSLRYAGFLQLAKQKIDRVLLLDPHYFSGQPVAHNPATLLYLGDYETYLELLLNNQNPYHGFYRALALKLSGNEAESQRVLTPIISKVDQDVFGYFAQALYAINLKEFTKAVLLMDLLSQRRLERKHGDGEITYKQAQLYALAGETEKALDNIALAVEQGFFNATYFLSDPVMRELKEESRFQTSVERAKKRHLNFAQKFNLATEIAH